MIKSTYVEVCISFKGTVFNSYPNKNNANKELKPNPWLEAVAS